MSCYSGQLLNILVAYPYLTADALAMLRNAGNRVRWVLDSGAFTAWKTGKIIDLDEYCRCIESLPVAPWRYFVLDVVGDPQRTRENYETMLRRGLNPVPIFTRGEKRAALDEYYKTSDVVGFGGLVGTKASSRLAYVHSTVKANKGRRVHLLGFTQMDHIKALRPYMCDSSSWEAAKRYGGAFVYMGLGRFVLFNRKSAQEKPSADIVERMYAMGFPVSELAQEAKWRGRGGLSRKVSAASWICASMELERNVGTHLFLSVTELTAMRVLIEQHERLTA